MKRKRIAALLLSLLLLLLCACAAEAPEPGTGDDPAPEAVDLRNANHRYLTLWSWQIPDGAAAEVYAQKALDCGFTAVDLGVLWTDFEPLRGHFDWSWLDAVVKAFADRGLGVSLQPLLWSKDLSWAEELVFQETPEGVFEVEERGSFVSFTDAQTLATVKNTLQNFALHASGYGTALTRWGVRLSCFGEMDYSVNEDLDYSASAGRAFCDYLKEIYADAAALEKAFSLGIASWEDLENLSCAEIAKVCSGDWRRFRQERMMAVAELCFGVLRSADKDVPIVFSLGTVGNGMNNGYSGILDLWTAANALDFDVLSVSLSDEVDPSMTLSCVTSLTTKKISVEVNGAGVWAEDDEQAVQEQVKICGAYGVSSLSTANFTDAQLDSYKEVLRSYEGHLSSAQPVAAADPAKAILVLTNGTSGQNPPRTYDDFYGEIWQTLSEQGTRRVRFVTDGQLASGVTTLEGVTNLYTGALKGKVSVTQEFLDALFASDAVIQGQGLTLVYPDGSAVLEQAAGLSSRVENS